MCRHATIYARNDLRIHARLALEFRRRPFNFHVVEFHFDIAVEYFQASVLRILINLYSIFYVAINDTNLLRRLSQKHPACCQSPDADHSYSD